MFLKKLFDFSPWLFSVYISYFQCIYFNLHQRDFDMYGADAKKILSEMDDLAESHSPSLMSSRICRFISNNYPWDTYAAREHLIVPLMAAYVVVNEGKFSTKAFPFTHHESDDGLLWSKTEGICRRNFLKWAIQQIEKRSK